jgi:hypothetical protein
MNKIKAILLFTVSMASLWLGSWILEHLGGLEWMRFPMFCTMLIVFISTLFAGLSRWS